MWARRIHVSKYSIHRYAFLAVVTKATMVIQASPSLNFPFNTYSISSNIAHLSASFNRAVIDSTTCLVIMLKFLVSFPACLNPNGSTSISDNPGP